MNQRVSLPQLFRRLPSPSTFRALGLATLLGPGAVFGCTPERRQDVKEWTPADHNNQKQPSAGQVDTSKARPGMAELEKQGINDVILATWKQNCVRCHGSIGRGDGPQGRMLQPPDFTDPVWQKNAMDTEMARTIQKGRGKMPGFAHLPAETVSGLVHLIRMMNPERTPTDAAAQQGTPAPVPSAAPPGTQPASTPTRPGTVPPETLGAASRPRAAPTAGSPAPPAP